MGALLVTLSVIYLEFKAHLTSILQRYAITSGLLLVGLSFVFLECAKLSSRQRVATLKNLKSEIYFYLFNTFLVTT